MSAQKLYRDYNSYLREIYGCRVQKITVDAGLTCPNRDGSLGLGGCIYCNSKGSGTGAARLAMPIAKQIESAKSILSKRYKAVKFIAYFQSYTNTYAPLPVLKQLYGEALSVRDVVGLSIGTRPDCVPDETLDHLRHLQETHSIWVEYGLQSAHDRTLERIRRGHTVQAFTDAVLRTRARNIPICVHVILGLPGESREDMLQTAAFLASQDIQALKIHLLYVVGGTVLEDWYRQGEYQCLTKEEYVSVVGDFLALLPPGMIIQRLTGDPHPDELVAPRWALEKGANLRAIGEHMERAGIYQGKAYPG